MINENNYSSEDCIGIIRIFLIKAKRILNLKKMTKLIIILKNLFQIINLQYFGKIKILLWNN